VHLVPEGWHAPQTQTPLPEQPPQLKTLPHPSSA
jgi:hypothetical protein